MSRRYAHLVPPQIVGRHPRGWVGATLAVALRPGRLLFFLPLHGILKNKQTARLALSTNTAPCDMRG